MANKTVENPCEGSSKPYVWDSLIVNQGRTYAQCGNCAKLVSVNKANRLTRKHTGAPTLWEQMEETSDQNEDIAINAQ